MELDLIVNNKKMNRGRELPIGLILKNLKTHLTQNISIIEVIKDIPLVYLIFLKVTFKFTKKLSLKLINKWQSHRNSISVRINPTIENLFNLEIKFRVFSLKILSLIILITISYISTIFYFGILKELPDINQLIAQDQRLTTTIYDKKGDILYRIYDDEDRTLATLEELPQDFINATIAIEDRTFYNHKGISISGITRALKKVIFDEKLEGGSTITQQLIKNTLLTSERTIERKIKEAVLSIDLERKLNKTVILEKYVNTISYGGTAYGIKSAARKYFGKTPNELTLAESAYLAGLPKAPSKLSPISDDSSMGKNRQYDVLTRMAEDGYITQEQAEFAYNQELNFNLQKNTIRAPHFVNYVISYLENEYGQFAVSRGGLEVYTSLDPTLQSKLEKVTENHVKELQNYNVTNGAGLITNPKTGAILAMVGSTDFWDIENDGNVNVTTSQRQPGSSIKPIMYSLALEEGFRPSYLLEDTPISYKIPGQPDYKPVNYDGRFHGTVTLKQALANSYNVPAVKMLDQIGVNKFINHAEKLGITTWNDRSRYGLSLTLGAGEVKMTDMAEAYGVFANSGYKTPLNPIIKIFDKNEALFYKNKCIDSPCKEEKIISENTSYFITDMLSDNRARTPAFGWNSALNTGKIPFAVKTGTTSNEKDNWAIGYNDKYVIVTWVGNNNGEPMKGVVSGYRGASIICRRILDYLAQKSEMPKEFKIPETLVEINICPLTNTLACEGCPNIKSLYVKGEEPKYQCEPEMVREILEIAQKNEDTDNENN